MIKSIRCLVNIQSLIINNFIEIGTSYLDQFRPLYFSTYLRYSNAISGSLPEVIVHW